MDAEVTGRPARDPARGRRAASRMTQWLVQERDGIVTAVHHNPPMNYLTSAGASELTLLIDRWSDPRIRAVVLTGGVEGRFITHFSVEELLDRTRDRTAVAAGGTAFTDAVQAYRQRLSALRKPVIAAMNGDTMGAGLEMSLACDIRIAQSGDHRFGFPEVKLGIMPSGTGTQRLPRAVGLGPATEMLLRGRLLTPEQALDVGLVHEVAGDARERAEQLAGRLASLSPRAVALIKRAVHQGGDASFRAGARMGSDAFFQALVGEDAGPLLAAYLRVPPARRRAWLEDEGPVTGERGQRDGGGPV